MGLAALGVPAGAAAAGGCPNEGLRTQLGSTGLPDCRAYEMVSPAHKSGVDVVAAPSRTRAAASDDAVQYAALGGFGDTAGAGALGTDYIAERGPDGWSSRGISPAQRPPSFPSLGGRYVGDLSSDLSTGVFFALSPLTSDPDVVNVRNLYLRKDLLSPGSGSYQLLSGCPGCENPLGPPPFAISAADPAFAGASRDFSHVIFESPNNLTSDASGTGNKLYEWVNGSVRLAGILPDSACGSPPCPAESSVGGAGAFEGGTLLQLLHNSISEDGSRIVFTAGSLEPASEILNTPHATTVSEGFGGTLYMRENGTTTIQLNASERTPAEAPGKAVFEGATADDSKVLFATTEKLTNDAAGTNANLYMYDVNAPAGHHLTLISKGSDPSQSEGIYAVDMSNDGNYIYFLATTNLLAGQSGPSSGRRLYVWHDGVVRYIGTRDAPGGGDVNWGEEGVSRNDRSVEARVSADGKTIVFVTYSAVEAEAAGYDNARLSCGSSALCEEVYAYNYDSNRVVCVSCDPSGAPPVGNAGVGITSTDASKLALTTHLSRAVTDDGGKVFFDSPDPLVPQDVNGRMDVYEYDVAAGEVHLISDGQSNSDALFVEASPDGHDVFFTTRGKLVQSDTDDNTDIYDARVDGGIAAQAVTAPNECAGDSCQGSLALPPALAATSSAGVFGNGNLTPVTSTPALKSKPKVKGKPKKKARRHRARAHKGRKSVKHMSRRAGR
jgi:Tol biopolymer transport system component